MKKFPTKISADSETDDSDSDRVESDSYKSVSFSPEVEVLEIAPRKKPVSPNKKFKNIKGLRTDGIKSRLGEFLNYGNFYRIISLMVCFPFKELTQHPMLSYTQRKKSSN